MNRKDKFIIVDGNALLHRAFHAMPPLTTKDGMLVNAVYGFVTILIRVMKEMKPKYAAVTFDLKEPTFRHKEYADYKATRIKQPDELYAQLPLIKTIVKAFQIPIYELKGFEADDIIGTISKKIENNDNVETYIITGDLDTLQLVDDNTKVYTLKKSIADTIIYDTTRVKERYQGLTPEQLIDFKALRGDPSDNIPGVKGIGEKIAIELLKKFKNLETIYKQFTTSTKITPRTKELLQQSQTDAFMSKKLATIVINTPIKFKLTDCQFQGVNRSAIVRIFQELEFKSLLAKIPELEAKLNIMNDTKKTKFSSSQKKSKTKYSLINNKASFKSFLSALNKQTEFAIDTETSGLDPLTSKLIGISLSWQAGEAYYIDWHSIINLNSTGKNTPPPIPPLLRGGNRGSTPLTKGREIEGGGSELIKEFSKILSNPKIKKIGHNIKFDLASLNQAGLHLAGINFDTMVAAYLLNSGERRIKLDNLVFSEFGHQMIPIKDLIGKKGKDQLSMTEVDINKLYIYACEDADYTFRLYEKLRPEIKQAKLQRLMDNIELPLIPVLFLMEKNGVKIDKSYLNKLNQQVTGDIASLENKIYKLAGAKFNISSPLQLKKILFTKLKISTEGLKKTKTGTSTAAGELEKMRNLHPVIDLISDYRELTKLQSTYIEALPELINPTTGRVHTSYNQTIAATGRLSSSDPNLQNIPIRTPLGKKIRGAFVAEPGNKLIAADYSQIELRVVAHLSGDINMINTFKANQDIHTATAAFIFDVPFNKIDSDMRRKAKEINFGIMYGMGPFGLSERTGISRFEAKQFIDRYFAKYSRMKKFTEEIVASARRDGYVETLFGRRRHLPDVNSGVAQIRNAAERAAINLPIQGTSADIMKLAMIAVNDEINKEHPDVKLMLQVHDELVLEVPEKKVNQIAKLLKQEMTKVAKLKVPLEVDVKAGDNWLEMEKI